MDAFEKVLAARDTNRPTGLSFLNAIVSDFVEFHGDRRFGDDPAVVGGVGRLGDLPITVICTEKGSDTKDRVSRNFGSAHPEGYRKALRLMKQAEKFRRPVLTLVDTAGAFCGLEAEERGQGLAIAENLMELMTLRTPVIAVVTGEGGSGGALALAVANQVWMLENAAYSVITPEGCASILWKDAQRRDEAAAFLGLTAEKLLELGLIDEVISEEDGDFDLVKEHLKFQLTTAFKILSALSDEELTRQRYEKFRTMGVNRIC
ncbi:MAG: acetyl-CoA carboxylase carboxyl transferase subunit alpha [Oscillospiraceae bacterium]|nr:acetyl-CoA carboxylase carboxyl transferase subunit alpha [Oscillospiraceae bacterium]